MNPPSGAQNSSVTVNVTGSQTHWCYPYNAATCPTPTSASFGGGINVTGISVTDLTHAAVTVQVPTNTSLGQYNVTLTTGGEVATIFGGFTVTAGSPVISSVSPPSGTQGTELTSVQLTGLFTHWDATSSAAFGSGITVKSLSVSSATQQATADIIISASAAIGSRTVTVTTGVEVATITGGFSVQPGVPALLSISPTTAQAGTTDNIVITGQFTTFQQSFSGVTMGSGVTVNFVTVNSLTQLTANIIVASNAQVGPRDVSVTTNGATQTLPGALSITAGTPVITQINPNIGNPGQTLSVDIYGQYTNWVSGTTSVSFGSSITVNTPITVHNAAWLTASITIPSGTALGPADVTTTTGGEVETVPGGFTIQAASIPGPYLISLSPGAGSSGFAINSVFTAVFSQPMMRSTINNSTVLLYITSNWTTIPGTVNLDATGRILTFTPNSLLAVNSQYYFNLTSGIQDATGNGFGSYGVYMSTSDAADITAPTVVATNPPANDASAGTNVVIQLEFSTPMDQATEAGMTVSTGGNAISGSYSWNAYPYCCGSGWSGPGTLLTFTPTNLLTPGTQYTVAWNGTLTDTAGNAMNPAGFSFTTGSGADTAQNYAGPDFPSGISGVPTNFVPRVNYSKPINPIAINTSTLQLYNYDSGKYVQGTVTVAPDGMSATFTPQFPLLPETLYQFHQAWGYYDSDGNYLNGMNINFSTGASQATTAPYVIPASVTPANGATSVPLNTNIMFQFSTPIDPDSVTGAVTLTPSLGGAAIAGTFSLAGDGVTMTFVPGGALQPGTEYALNVSGYADLAGNAGTSYSSQFMTFNAAFAPINVSTGVNASGVAILTGGTQDPNWSYYPTSSIPSGETNIQYPGMTPLYVVAPGEADWYGGWVANGPNASWIAINPNNPQGNTAGFYSTPFTLPTPLPSSHICVVGYMSHDDSGLLAVNGQPIMGDQGYTGNQYWPFNIDITTYVTAGTNYLTFAFGSTDNNLEGVRLQGEVEACGTYVAGGLSFESAIPAYGASNVATNATIQLTFSNPLLPESVNSTTLPVMVGGNSNQEIAGTYSVNGNIVTFTPNGQYPANSTIWVGTCNGPTDVAGDTIGGCYNQQTYFTTVATPTVPVSSNPLLISAFTPANGATNVGLRAPVAATFNHSINVSSVNSGDFALFAGDGQSPWCTNWWHSQDDATIQFNCYALPSSATMTAILGSGIQDWMGNSLAATSSMFTTAQWDSNTNGTVVGTRPGNGASSVDPSQPISFYLNYPVVSATVQSGIQVAENNQNAAGSFQVLDNGYVIVFTPSVAWTPGALVQWWTNGALIESTYNTPYNGASGYFYVAGSITTATPTVQVASPGANTSNVPTNAQFSVQFNTPINPSTVNSTNIYLFDNSNSNMTVPATVTQPEPNVIHLNPNSALPANHYIYLQVTNGLQSTTSVPAQQTNWWEYTGAGPDSSTLTVTTAVPFNGAQNVGINVTPGVIFSKQIDPTTVNSNTFQVLSGGTALPGNFWFNSADTRVDFVPYDALPSGTQLKIVVNGVTDLESNPVTNFSSTFTTGAGPELGNPSVIDVNVPSNGSVPTNTVVTLQFSASLDTSTFTVGEPGNCHNIYIYDYVTGTCINATLTWSADQSEAYLAPTAPLAAGREYQVWVGSGTDLAGNQLNNWSENFYAEFSLASVAPTVIYFNPLPGASGVATPSYGPGTNAIIEAQFSAPIDPTTLGGVVLSSSGGNVAGYATTGAGNTIIQFVPAAPLVPNTTYTMTIAGVKDPTGNPVAQVTNMFTTGASYDPAAASVTTTDPAYNATVGTNVLPKFVFNKPLNPISVNNNTFRMYLYDTGQWVPLTVTPSLNGLEVTMTPQVALLPGTRYHVQACCGFQDQDGNNGNSYDLYFWTTSGAVSTGPTVSVSPSNGATGIPLNAEVIAMISAPLDSTTVGQNAIQLFDSSNSPVPGNVVQASNQEITFTPTTSTPVPAGTYLGCYNDNSNRVLGWEAYDNPSNSVETCTATCAANGYSYAGAQAGSQCFCGNGPYNSAGQGNACNSTCTGNQSEICGGGWANSVYTAKSVAIPGLFNAGTTYTVKVNNFNDANGNPVQAYSGTFTTTTNSALPSTGLTYSGANIAWWATVTSPTQQICLTFSEPLDPFTVNSNTLLVMNGWNSNNGLAGTYTVGGTCDGNPVGNNTVGFTPLSPYPSGATIYVGECGGPTDVLGEVFQNGNCYSQQLLAFHAPSVTDTTPLQVLSVSPMPGATNVPPDSSVSVTFNKSINPYSVYNNNNNALLFAGQGLQDRGSINMSADDRVLTFNVGTLYQGAVYTIELPAGGISDPSGNTLASTYSSTFTTATYPSTGNGSVIGAWPGGGATSVPTNTLLTLWLNRPANPSTATSSNVTVAVNGTVYPGSLSVIGGGYEVQYTPATAFPAGAIVQWSFSNVYDTSGNVFNGNGNVFYTAAAVNPATAQPTVIAWSPVCCNSSLTPTNTEIDIQYSLPINPASLGGVFQNGGPSAGALNVSLASPTVVRISPPSGGWNANTEYGFCANSNVQGTNGVGAQYSCWGTYFNTTASPDTTPGTVIIGPPNNATGVGTNAYFRFQFSKPADRTTINASTIQITTGGNPIPGSFSYNYSNADLWGVNFQPLNPLPVSSTISIVTNGILDYAGNTFTPANVSFTTAAGPDYSPPSVSLDFGNGQTGVGTNASFTCLYSEAMDPSSVTSGNTYLWSYVTNARVPVSYTWAPGLMAVTMTPTSPLWANSEYQYQCTGGIDLTGNGQNGASSYFYTGAGSVALGPQLINANPPNGLTNVPLNTEEGPWNGTSLQLQFNTPVSSDSMGNITLTPAGGSALPISVNPVWGNTIAVISLPWTLAPNTAYTFNASGVTDLNGNPATGATTSTFTTGAGFDWTNAGVISALPVNGVDSVPTSGATISVTFNEIMDPVLIDSNHIYLRNHNTNATIPTTLAVSNDTVGYTTTVTLTPTGVLDGNTIFDVVVTNPYWCMTDVAGNNMNNCGGQVVTSFTTAAAVMVNGACGPANGQTTTSVPAAANLCSAGTATGFNESFINNTSSSFTWTCMGLSGGANSNQCSSTVTSGACYPQQPGLVSWWPGNGNANDLIGGNNGITENGAGFAPGEVDDAFSLNGSNQFVLIGEPVPANLQIQNAFTLSAWIYPTAYPTDYGSGALGMILGSQYDGAHGGTTIYFDGRVNPDNLGGIPIGHIAFQIGDGNNWHSTDTETQVPLNQWTLITATRVAGGPPIVYYNGVSQPLETNTSGDSIATWNGVISYPSSTWFAIGQQSNENRPFTGLIDEAQIYNVALTPAQIQGIYNAGAAAMCELQTPTTTTVSSTVNPAQVGLPVTFTASVSPSSATGTVTFMDGVTTLGTEQLNGGQATLSTSALTVGQHSITALYYGDTTYSGSQSASLPQVINNNIGACVSQPSGLLSWWSGEGNGNDQMGLNNLTLYNSAAFATGFVGKAFNFSSDTGSSSGYARNSSTQSIPASGPIGFAAWIKYDSTAAAGSNPEVLTLDGPSACGNGILHGIVLGGKNTVAIARGCGASPNFNCGANVNIGDNHWHLVVTGWDGANSTVYLDGSLAAQCSGADFTRDVSWVSLGGRPDQDSGNSPYVGLADEVQIYNRALNASEVQALYTAGANGMCGWQSSPANGINVISGTYGGNCGVPTGNKTAYLATACNNLQSCAYSINYGIIGDPAPGCAKNYVAVWQCGNNPATYQTSAGAEAGYGSVIQLNCQ